LELEFQDQEHIISFYTFNGLGIKMLHFLDRVSEINELNADSYQPNSMTPLYDAMGIACNKLENVLKNQKNQNYNVLVTVLTDGLENHSTEYTNKAIKEMVGRLKENNWTFTYIGTDHDVDKIAESLDIENVMMFDKNPIAMKMAFSSEINARHNFSRKIRDKEDVKVSFYE